MQGSFNITVKKQWGIFLHSKCEQNRTEILVLSEQTKHLNPNIAFLCLAQSLSYYVTNFDNYKCVGLMKRGETAMTDLQYCGCCGSTQYSIVAVVAAHNK